MDSDHRLSQAFLEAHPYEAGLVLEKFAPVQVAEFLGFMPESSVVGVLQRMMPSSAAAALFAFAPDRAGPTIEALPLETAARMLRCLSGEQRTLLLAKVSAGHAALLERLLVYPLDSAGALMDPQILAISAALRADEALDRVQRSPQHSLYYIYIVDAEQKLVGVMNLRELMLAVPSEQLAAAMRTPVEKLFAGATLSAILLHSGWREFHALPVTDDSGIFLGAIRYKTLKRLEQESRQSRVPAESMTALLSLGELCWIGFAGMLAGLAATVFPPTLTSHRGEESGHDATQ